MAGDAGGMQGNPPVPGPERTSARRARPDADLVGPCTVGGPRWHRRHARAAHVLDAAALACSPGLYLLWREVVALPLVAAAASAVVSVALVAAAGRGALLAWLHRLRRRGRALSSVLAVGTVTDIRALVARTRAVPRLGWRLDAACTSTGRGADDTSSIAGVPVVGDLDGIAALALTGQFDAVAVGPAAGWTSTRLQQLSWRLDGSRVALLVDPRLVGLAGPRMRVTGVPGLSLLRLDQPTLAGAPRLLKGAVDRVAALLALVVVAPVLVGCALAVRRDGGPALRRQPRLGRGGREFTLFTFRTTGPDGDPTPAGRVLARHCLDELPQLLNVLGGSLSLVGPRPLVPGADPGVRGVQRRLLVKPGITGLWQVGIDADSGDGLAELDRRYAQRWSLALDSWILLRTVRDALSSLR